MPKSSSGDEISARYTIAAALNSIEPRSSEGKQFFVSMKALIAQQSADVILLWSAALETWYMDGRNG